MSKATFTLTSEPDENGTHSLNISVEFDPPLDECDEAPPSHQWAWMLHEMLQEKLEEQR